MDVEPRNAEILRSARKSLQAGVCIVDGWVGDPLPVAGSVGGTVLTPDEPIESLL